jgi:hypothetical protein
MDGWRQRLAVLAIVLGLVACATPMQRDGAMASDASIPAQCHPRPDPDQAQYVIGYGSLMQDESRKRTSPQAGPAHPVDVRGYRRGWFARGNPVGFSTTYLGALPDGESHLNAVVFHVDVSELMATDQREVSYCRRNVPLSDIRALDQEPSPATGGQAWIYTNDAQTIATPSARFPIVQSYVDIFVSGCLEQEQRFELKGFAQQCLATTQDWSAHWVNDRIYPRRPFIHQPKSRQIDTLLSQQLPDYFSRIKIE